MADSVDLTSTHGPTTNPQKILGGNNGLRTPDQMWELESSLGWTWLDFGAADGLQGAAAGGLDFGAARGLE